MWWYDRRDRWIMLCAAHRALDITAGLLRDYVAWVASRSQVVYGYAFSMPYNAGPEWHAMGYGFGGLGAVLVRGLLRMGDSALDRQRCAWRDELWGPRRFALGMLRDVYEVNLLSSVHLARAVHGTPLESLIHEQNWGDLSPVTADLKLWRLAKPDVRRARQSLGQAGLLVGASS